MQAVDPEIAKAKDDLLNAYARRKMAQVVYENCERSAAALSRELTRRLGRDPMERRNMRCAAVNIVRSLWASVQGDPIFMRRVNGYLTVFWIVMIPVSILTGWISSVTYVAALSLWALVSGTLALGKRLGWKWCRTRTPMSRTCSPP